MTMWSPSTETDRSETGKGRRVGARRLIHAAAAVTIAGAMVATGTLARGHAASINNSGAHATKGKGPKVVVDDHLKAMRSNGATLALVNQPPFSGLSPTGEATGASPEISIAILHKLGVTKINFVPGAYGDMIPGLNASRFDFVTASLSITHARCQQVLFSDPLIVDGVSFAQKKGSKAFTSVKQVAGKSDVHIGFLTGSVYIGQAETAGLQASQVLTFSDVQSGIAAVLAGRVDAMIGSTSGFHTPAVDISQLTVSKAIKDMPRNPSGAAFKLGDGVLRGDYNLELAALKKSGQYDKILKKYGFNPALARKAKLSEACQH